MAQEFRNRIDSIAAAAEGQHGCYSITATPSLRPYEVPASLQSTIDRLGLQQNIDELREKGYTVLRDVASLADVEEINLAVKRLGKKGAREKFAATLDLFGSDPCFDKVALNEKMYALSQVMCGQGCLLSQMVASINRQVPKGTRVYGMHADQNWLPAPFPEHNQILTCCWTLNGDYTAEEGATLLVPYSHLLRRHPNTAELAMQKELCVPVECKKGEMVCWDGSIWHSFGLRTVPGHRVVIHTTFSRLAYLPMYAYGKHRNVQEVLARHSGVELQKLKSMLGLENWNRFFLKDPTQAAHNIDLQAGAPFHQTVTLARGQYGSLKAEVPSARESREAQQQLDALRKQIASRL